MLWKTRDEAINAWWERQPGEHFWLDVTRRDDWDTVLAAPRGTGRHSEFWTRRLITHVSGGDVVFRYDAFQRAIVAWSMAYGRVEKRDVWWPNSSRAGGHEFSSRRLPSWGIGLRQSTRLDVPVPVDEIARVQSQLFPSLRALEDDMGDPLYYPFEMGNREATRPLAGYVFKLPSVLVQSVPALASAAARAARPPLQYESAPVRSASPMLRRQTASR